LAGRILTPEEAGIIATAITQERLQVVKRNQGSRCLGSPASKYITAAAAPLRAHGATVGALAVTDHGGGPFRDEDLRLLSTVATHAAIVPRMPGFSTRYGPARSSGRLPSTPWPKASRWLTKNGRVRRANRALADLLKRPLPAVIGLDLGAELAGRFSELTALFAAARTGVQRPGLSIHQTG